ncbi:hypothetical protein J2T60_002343 [Natronospira proteinivora]|uniref:Transporter n=1 Tax=Natronospira proteinivora TaxID=1807133 RepID=A0ABT1GD97_9GAMM|nr:transporter [Natronospira proteinivora]MCP1728343.1 hypothetical protein [Natronospira proteinivora]
MRQSHVANVILGIALLILSGTVSAHWTSDRPDGHAPMGVMADHVHSRGEWMVALQHSRMSMSGLRDGSDWVSPMAVQEDYHAAPLGMDMDMSMLMLMYAPSDRLTLMGMLHHMDSSMESAMHGMGSSMETSGLGDSFLGGIYKALDADGQQLLINFGVSLPTGSIDEDVPMMGMDMRAGYPMQLGSGTYDLMPGMTWLGQGDHWSWGAQAMATLRLGSNDESYTLGDEFNLTAWAARRLTSWLSLSARLEQTQFGNVDGADPAMNPDMNPAADPRNQGGDRTQLGVGANIQFSGALSGHRLGLEYIEPIRERLDGPQMSVDSTVVLAWELAW